jgi:hypothetical protein
MVRKAEVIDQIRDRLPFDYAPVCFTSCGATAVVFATINHVAAEARRRPRVVS